MQVITIQEMQLISAKISNEVNFINGQLFKGRQPNSKKWLNVQHPEHGSKVLINYTSIPTDHKIRLGLPLDYSEAQKLIKEHKKAKEDAYYYEGKQPHSFRMETAIRKYVEKNWVKFYSIFLTNFNNNTKKAEPYAKEQALRFACFDEYKQGNCSLRELLQVYVSLSELRTVNNYSKFTMEIKKWDEITLLHGHLGKERNDIRKVDEQVAAWIEYYAKHPNQFSHALIAEMVNTECKQAGKKTIVRRTVTDYMNHDDVRNRIMMYRNPEQWRKVNQPRLRRLKAFNPGDLAYMDGTPLQIPCWNRAETKVIRPTLYAIIDQCSGYIGGWSLSESEDRYSVISAMKMWVKMTGFIPHELKHDNASSMLTGEIGQLREKWLMTGGNLAPCTPGEPTQKADIERFFGAFQSYQRRVDGFQGEGIMSKRDTARVDIDFLKKHHKKNGYYSFETMLEITGTLIAAYNQTKRARSEAPGVLFAKERPNAILIAPEQVAFLFWAYKEIKVAQAEVVTTIRHNQYIYEIFDSELALRLNGKKVRVYYQENDLSEVCLFTEQDEYLTTIKQKVKIPAAPVNQTPEDVQNIIKQTSHNNALKGIVEKETAKVADILTANEADNILAHPLQYTKEQFNNAETAKLLSFLRDEYSIDNSKVKDFVPVEQEPTSDINDRYAKKHFKKGSLEIVR